MYRKVEETTRKVEAIEIMIGKVATTERQELERLIDEACGEESHPFHFLYRGQLFYGLCLQKGTIESALKKDLQVLKEMRDVAAFRLIHRDSSRAVT